ncbi:MAG: purine-nucleoside phosphorylase [Verrucomicrobiaceae bacterium]
MATPHLEASEGQFAETVLLPGDPLRANFIAETFLEDVEQVNGVRNMLGFTGTYEGVRISVMGSGMGIPSISIYAKELITDYGVKNLIRVGSCGAVSKEVKVRDVLIGMGGCTDSGVNRARFGGYDFAAIADYDLLAAHVEAARELGVPVKVGNLFSADLFYTPQPEMFDRMEKMNVLGVEMEAAGLFGVCAEFGARGMAICTVSDHIRTGESTTSEERQTSFTAMMKVALEAARKVAS